MESKVSSRLPSGRLRLLNPAPVQSEGDYVLYWMTGARRTQWNFALERAVEWTRQLQRPLVVLEALRVDYPWASDRHHAFIMRGMAENQVRLHSAGVTSYSYVEPSPGAGKGLLAALGQRACVVVTDDVPFFFMGRMTAKGTAPLKVRAEAVDSNGLLPIRLAEKVYSTAASFRRFLHLELPARLADFPVEDPLHGVTKMAAPTLDSVQKRWQPVNADEAAHPEPILARLPIDHDVPMISGQGGLQAGERRLRTFLNKHLQDYGASGRRTLENSSSGLSPYLHYGQVSPHQIVREIFTLEGWSPEHMNESCRGRREGWWGLSQPAESFLDQLVTWRELGLNMHTHHPHPESYDSLPSWAQETLGQHRGDAREYTYDISTFESAQTHDPLWNAAQRQLLKEGTIHNYLRMLWGKKILEWSESPEEALAVMLHLNNRHALDGRDPNSTSGIFWTLGRYDRPWFPERPVFGRIRFMSSANTARKMRVKDYLSSYGEA